MVRLIAKSKNIPGKNHIKAIQTLMIHLIISFDQSQETVILPFLPCDRNNSYPVNKTYSTNID